MAKKQKYVIGLTMFLAMCFGVTQNTYAMHIMEGYLSLGYCVGWGTICLPFLAGGMMKLKKITEENRKTMLILAMAGAYAFVLSALKIPSVTGSSSHPTGTGLGAILFGPLPMTIIGFVVLLFQAVLLAHGGLSTLGANTFSMAIAGPFVSFFVYKISQRCKINRLAGIFLAAAIGDLATYAVTSFQLAVAYPSAGSGMIGSLQKFMGVFAVTQIPLAVIEGLLTVTVIIGLEAYAKPELTELGYFRKEIANER